MKAFLIAASALALAGCSTLVPTSVTLPAGQGLLVAEAAVDGANHIATVAAQSGALKGPKALTVKHAVDAANNATSAAHSLYAKGDVSGTVGQLKTAFDNISIIQTETKK
jgi:hypothetical protein